MKAVQTWLKIIILLIALIVAVGGITRITGSGLSITEWKPIMGAIPPLNETEWAEAFEKYKMIPQFQQINSTMTLSEFKWIFFWEYFHRLIGRLIGLAFGLPLVIFLARKQIEKRWIAPLIGLFVLGGLQGFMGWFMVKSGLSELTYVSHYRLAAHLLLAFFIASYTLYLIKKISSDLNPQAETGKPTASQLVMFQLRGPLLGVVLVQTLYGAFTAGLKSGYMSPTFPKMGPDWFPASFWGMDPVFRNLFDNPISVQWIHRLLATVLLVTLLGVWIRNKNHLTIRSQKVALTILTHLVGTQYLLGIGVVLWGVPVWLGTLHQVVGFAIFLAAVNFWVEFRPNLKQA